MCCEHTISHDIDEHLIDGEPIWVKTRSNHWSGPFKWSSIQHGVDVTVWRRYSAPQPLTKDILIVHILVSPYTASNPWLTDCVSSEANSWLLNIFKLQPGGILHTYILSKRSNTYLVYRFFWILLEESSNFEQYEFVIHFNLEIIMYVSEVIALIVSLPLIQLISVTDVFNYRFLDFIGR